MGAVKARCRSGKHAAAVPAGIASPVMQHDMCGLGIKCSAGSVDVQTMCGMYIMCRAGLRPSMRVKFFMQKLCTCIFEAGVYEHVMIVYKSCSSRGFSYSALYFFSRFQWVS